MKCWNRFSGIAGIRVGCLLLGLSGGEVGKDQKRGTERGECEGTGEFGEVVHVDSSLRPAIWTIPMYGECRENSSGDRV